MSVNNSQSGQFPTELATTVLTGGFDLIGTLQFNPVILIFDNQSTSSIQISVDGVNTWRTFPAGEALVLDLRDKIGLAANFTFDVGTTFFAKGTAGANVFSISYIYAKNT
jgi:hypothetical protein